MADGFPLMQFSAGGVGGGAASPSPSSAFPSVEAFKQQQLQGQQQHRPPHAALGSGSSAAPAAGDWGTGSNPFKSQLHRLTMELDGFSRRVGGGGGGSGESLISASQETAAAMGYRDRDDLKQQLGGLSTTMEQVNSHLEVDRLEKKQMQDEIDRLKLQLSAALRQQQQQQQQQPPPPAPTPAAPAGPSTAHLEHQLGERAEEVASLREEKAVMKEWLDRGVSECRRVAEEVQRLRRELEDNDGERGRLGEEKARLEEMLERVMHEARETREGMERERGEKEAALGDAAASTRTAAQSSEDLRQARAEADRLASEVARLLERVRDTEEAEMHLRTLVSGMRRTSNGFLALHTAVEQDRLGDLIAPATGDGGAEGDAAGSGDLGVVVSNGKACLAELQDVLLALRAVVRTRLEDNQQRCAELAQRETESAHRAVEGARRVEQEIRERHQIEKKLLESKLQELEYELSGLSTSNVQSQQLLSESEQEAAALRTKLRDMELASGQPQFASVADHAGKHLAELDRFQGNDEELASKAIALEARCSKLEAGNAKLKEKNTKMKVDWGKVGETRQYCQKLELEKRTMQGYIEKVELENEALRRRAYGGGAGGAGGAPHGPRALSPSKHREAEQSSAAWREWQRAQSSFEGWKSAVSMGATTAFASPTKASASAMPVHTPAATFTPYNTTGPWMPTS